ncbi:ATP-grasp fold amidoligase family protein [Zobellella iuensis]|uniref:ATP-grasp domain-containing protein n=1 Tax=Zobellella iuensis TaxID=2803811 RepID=A0ABS1QSC1_9GAMM|nr:ATP-grasp fold amidoligase family protein [Zobellella iuensis]MBL1377764.1 hypothetical protein [Zobellella iuensis]
MSLNSQESIEMLLDSIKNEELKIKDLQAYKARLTEKLLKELNGHGKEHKTDTLKKLSALLSVDELTEPVTRLFSQSKVPLYQAASFKRLLVQATRKRQLYNFQPEWKLNNKRYAYEFIDKLGIKRPETYTQKASLASITLQPGSVLKPENGASSIGVFIIGHNNKAQEVRTGELMDLDLVIEKARHYLDKKMVQSDQWILEEFVGDFEDGSPLPARDLKFYCFYGEIGFVLEVDRTNKARYCEWMPDGTLADTGRYASKRFDGNGFSPEEKHLAENISKQIPTPFIRIDFLKNSNRFVFGEFTPRPGQFSSFSQDFDRYLGECYLKAESKLMQSILDNTKR